VTSVAIAIQAHPARRAWANELSAQLQAPVIWSNGYAKTRTEVIRDVWDTHAVALRFLSSQSADHALVISDDAILATNFLPRLMTQLSRHRNDAVQLFYRDWSGKRLALKAWETGKHGFWCQTAVAGIGTSLPMHHVRAIADFGDTITSEQWRNHPDMPAGPVPDDQRIYRYLRKNGVKCWVTLPSLLEHRPDGTSLTPGKRGFDFGAPNKSAWRFDVDDRQ